MNKEERAFLWEKTNEAFKWVYNHLSVSIITLLIYVMIDIDLKISTHVNEHERRDLFIAFNMMYQFHQLTAFK